MKKTFITFVSIVTVAAFVSSAWAIDRAPKKSGSDSKKETTEIQEMTKEKAKRKPRKSTFSERSARTTQSQKRTERRMVEKRKGGSEAKKSKEKYDYFIDANQNGIDDRLEKEAKARRVKDQEPARKPQTTGKITPRPPDKAPAKIKPAPKPPEKVKEGKAAEKRKASEVKEGERKPGPRRR